MLRPFPRKGALYRLGVHLLVQLSPAKLALWDVFLRLEFDGPALLFSNIRLLDDANGEFAGHKSIEWRLFRDQIVLQLFLLRIFLALFHLVFVLLLFFLLARSSGAAFFEDALRCLLRL